MARDRYELCHIHNLAMNWSKNVFDKRGCQVASSLKEEGAISINGYSRDSVLWTPPHLIWLEPNREGERNSKSLFIFLQNINKQFWNCYKYVILILIVIYIKLKYTNVVLSPARDEFPWHFIHTIYQVIFYTICIRGCQFF